MSHRCVLTSICSGRGLRTCAQLWKRLYVGRFAARSRRISRLPKGRSWKQLYRIQQNWLDGNAKSTALDIRSSVLEPPPVDLAVDGPPGSPRAVDAAPLTIVRFSGRRYYTASRMPSDTLPVVEVHLALPAGSRPLVELQPQSLQMTPGMAISEVAIDEGDPSRVAVYYTDGQSAIFALEGKGEDDLSWSEVHASTERGDAVVLASLHSPLLVTCTADLAVTFLSLVEAKDGAVTLKRIASPMRSALTWSPLVLTLSALAASRFRVNIAHAVPHFPGSWTVALHEFDIDLVTASVVAREATAPPTSTSPVTALEFRRPWLVASRADNTLDCYHARTSSSPTRPLSLSHLRTLYGHTAAVKTVSVGRGGRCVSGGIDGRLKVWRLPDPAARVVEVWERPGEQLAPPPPTVSWVGFDEERIVCVKSPRRTGERESVRVLSFDQ
jgi:WD40 repeat protein